eukprot:g677.t1
MGATKQGQKQGQELYVAFYSPLNLQVNTAKLAALSNVTTKVKLRWETAFNLCHGFNWSSAKVVDSHASLKDQSGVVGVLCKHQHRRRHERICSQNSLTRRSSRGSRRISTQTALLKACRSTWLDERGIL